MAGLAAERQQPYRRFAAELGLIFQIVDDVLDADSAGTEPSYVRLVGVDRARELAAEADVRARAHLAEAGGDTGELEQLADVILYRTA